MWPIIIIGLVILLALLDRQGAGVSMHTIKEPGDWWGPWMGQWTRSGGDGAAWQLKGDQGHC